MNLKVIFILVIITGCSTGFGANSSDTTNIYDKIITANENIDSYSINMNTQVDTTMEVLGRRTNSESVVESTGDIDRKNKRIVMQGTITTGTSKIVTETYVAEGFIYTKIMDVWGKTALDDSVWSFKDQVGQLLKLLRSGTIEVEDEDQQFYKIKITPDQKILRELYKQQSIPRTGIDRDLMKSYSLTLWINKNTLLIQRSKIDTQMILTAEKTGVQGYSDIEITSTIDIKISNINKEFTITIPQEARATKEMKNG